jgi:hypothetical protein
MPLSVPGEYTLVYTRRFMPYAAGFTRKPEFLRMLTDWAGNADLIQFTALKK